MQRQIIPKINSSVSVRQLMLISLVLMDTFSRRCLVTHPQQITSGWVVIRISDNHHPAQIKGFLVYRQPLKTYLRASSFLTSDFTDYIHLDCKFVTSRGTVNLRILVGPLYLSGYLSPIHDEFSITLNDFLTSFLQIISCITLNYRYL